MIKGEKIRIDIHNILYSILKHNKNLNNSEIKKIINKHNQEDIALLNNVTLNSMRMHLHTSKIIKKYIKKKLRDHEKILLISAITQIVYLDFKEYAVINCSVEIAKKFKIYHGLINACLKKISKDKDKLKKIIINFEDLPLWFQDKTKLLTKKQKVFFLNNFNREPSLHIVFKSKEYLNKFEEELIKTTNISGFLKVKKDIKKIKSFIDGDWWVQDFSSFFPLQNLQNIEKFTKYLDACAAPGGKSFQLLSRKINITLNDKSISRITTLKSNLKRLGFNAKIFNCDFTKLKENQKYDFIIVDAPCSALGTIRKNPEIFFKSEGPNFRDLNLLQENMLNKASNLLNKNGLILYMVCSFLKCETVDQIDKFLRKKNDFILSNFELIVENNSFSKLFDNNFMITLPDTINGYSIDGYFAAYLQKTK